MNKTWDKLDRGQVPTEAIVAAYVDDPLWDEICQHLLCQYESKPVFEYSGCSVPGWNVKYKKAGRSLCTLYPMEHKFIALVVIGEREKQEFDLASPTLTQYTQNLYETTKDKKGLCWLMFEVESKEVLDDVKTCIAMRRKLGKNSSCSKYA